jgi:EAL domain-containing protein (putative c-di-GMP-specific phosphodiesterase class I)
VAGHEVFATASIGIALCVREYEHPDEVLRDADTAMYKAKASGRAQYSVFEPGMHTHAVERLRLETDLRRAVERKEFVVFYQPIFSLATNHIVGFEGLVRWQHPERGLLNPEDFLKLADETGIIVSIDRLVLREACRQMHAWMTQFPDNGISFIGTNLSNKQITQPDFVDYVSRVLKETGLSPRHLKLEITENVIIENPEETIAMLSRLKALGVQLYIDDFGTGYSSLSRLQQFPVDSLKIDRAFISQMDSDAESHKIVQVIIMLAQTLGLTTVGEGAETEEHVNQLKALDCGFAQGYYFSKPADHQAISDLLMKVNGSGFAAAKAQAAAASV